MNKKLEAKINDIIENGVDREKYPENRIGDMAKRLWNNPIFTLGMEYGYILALMEENKKRNK